MTAPPHYIPVVVGVIFYLVGYFLYRSWDGSWGESDSVKHYRADHLAAAVGVGFMVVGFLVGLGLEAIWRAIW